MDFEKVSQQLQEGEEACLNLPQAQGVAVVVAVTVILQQRLVDPGGFHLRLLAPAVDLWEAQESY